MRPYLPKRPAISLLSENLDMPQPPVADNTFLVNDYIAPFVEFSKEDNLAYSLLNIQDYGLAANATTPDSKITACYWEAQTNIVYYGTDRGEVFRFSFDRRKEERVKAATFGGHEDYRPIAKLYVTKKNWVWCLQNKRMEKFDLGLAPSAAREKERQFQAQLEPQVAEAIEESHICFCQEDKFIYRQLDQNKYCKIFIDDEKNELVDAQYRIPEDCEAPVKPQEPPLAESLDLSRFEAAVDGTPG